MKKYTLPFLIAGMGILAGGIFAWQSNKFRVTLDGFLHVPIRTFYNVQVGDVVHYVLPGARCVPGIILDVISAGGLSDLAIFDSQASRPLNKEQQYVMTVVRNVSPSDDKKAGTWHYLELDRISHVKTR